MDSLAEDFRVKPAPGFMEEYRKILKDREREKLRSNAAMARAELAAIHKRIIDHQRGLELSPFHEVRAVGWTDVISRVATAFSISPAAILGPSRLRLHVRARHAAIATLAARGNSMAQIGRWLNRDHTTVIYAVRKFEAEAPAEDRLIVQALSA